MADLTQLIEEAKAKVEAMTPDERRAMYAAQRASWVRGEMAMGSDSDEAAYRSLLDQRGRFRAEYKQSGAWPDRFWWYAILDEDGHEIATCADKGVGDFIVESINRR